MRLGKSNIVGGILMLRVLFESREDALRDFIYENGGDYVEEHYYINTFKMFNDFDAAIKSTLTGMYYIDYGDE